MSQRDKVEAGDVIELSVRFRVHSVEHMGSGTHGPAYTNLTYEAGEPRPDGFPGAIFTFELPDEFGRVVILSKGEQDD